MRGQHTVLENGTIRFDVHALWLEGTGRLAGVTGEADVIAILEAVAPGAEFHYVTKGTLTLPVIV